MVLTDEQMRGYRSTLTHGHIQGWRSSVLINALDTVDAFRKERDEAVELLKRWRWVMRGICDEQLQDDVEEFVGRVAVGKLDTIPRK